MDSNNPFLNSKSVAIRSTDRESPRLPRRYPLRLVLTAGQVNTLVMSATTNVSMRSRRRRGSNRVRAELLAMHDEPRARFISYLLQLFGSANGCSSACRRLLTIACPDPESKVTLQFFVDSAYIGLLIGSLGKTIEAIRLESRASVHIEQRPIALMTDRQSFAFTIVQLVCVSGRPDAVATAVQLLLAKASSRHRQNRRQRCFQPSERRWLSDPDAFLSDYIAAREFHCAAQRLARLEFYGTVDRRSATATVASTATAASSQQPRLNDCWKRGRAAAAAAASTHLVADSAQPKVSQLKCRVQLTCFYLPAGVDVIKAVFRAGKSAAAASGHELSAFLIASPEYQLVLTAYSAHASTACPLNNDAMAAVLKEIESTANETEGCEFQVLEQCTEEKSVTPTSDQYSRLRDLLPLTPTTAHYAGSSSGESSDSTQRPTQSRQSNAEEPIGCDDWKFAFSVTFVNGLAARVSHFLSIRDKVALAVHQ